MPLTALRLNALPADAVVEYAGLSARTKDTVVEVEELLDSALE